MFRGERFFLSNMSPCRIEHAGLVFGSVEAAFQASKCVSAEARARFVGLSGSEAKRLGRLVELRPDWDSRKDGFMLFWLRRKFADPVLARRLLDTGDEELVEHNTWGDTYWGVCRGVGQNRLGKLLMHVRAELRAA